MTLAVDWDVKHPSKQTNKNKKNICVPVNPSFAMLKWGLMWYMYIMHGCVILLEQNAIEVRRNISIGIPLNLSIPTEMGYIQPLVENEIQQKCKIVLF